MANNKMLIDATHPEETRVVVLRNSRVEEFDYESAARKLLRGNIYLAKVTRVEPSLQAAFVDYGGNRHGFLAFNEIHPDYYQIPMADRQALLDEEAAAEAREEAEADARAERLARRQQERERSRNAAAGRSSELSHQPHTDADEGDLEGDDEPEADERDEGEEPEVGEAGDDRSGEPSTLAEQSGMADERLSEEAQEAAVEITHAHADDVRAERAADDEGVDEPEAGAPDQVDNEGESDSEGNGIEVVAPASPEAEAIEQTGAEDALEELPSRPRRRPRSYKIQEVIKRRQIILVQVVKEERGTKGAALTTYLSLAGRYTVLMPNTARGGGISRKITNPQDRKRLKAIAAELDVPEGMGLIIRTAGAARTKQEIKRDFEYLLRLWESVRELTLQSTAPSLVYEEGNLIKRSIRDLYDKDVEEIVVAGAKAYEEAHDFMRMLMPSHARNVHHHLDSEPLFTKYGIERQLNAMFSPYVTLRSGGYLVINQTEALVAVDVNSGKATREFSIEETAYHTNLEAADEIARQLKLRDLAGLIVIDFIDMEEKRNNRSVERRLKDALRFDRARIQLGRISPFGLMEMSRQRMRTGVLEGSTSQCPHCQGTGIIRSTESVALAVLRGLEDALMQGARSSLIATTTAQVALYILNNKRQFINDMESRSGVSVTVQASDKLQGANFTIERGGGPVQPQRRPERAAVSMDWGFDSDEPIEADGEDVIEPPARGRNIEVREQDRYEEAGDDRSGRRRRRRRGRRGSERGAAEGRLGNGDRPQRNEQPYPDERTRDGEDEARREDDEDQIQGNGEEAEAVAGGENGQQPPRGDGERTSRRRRRGRRGGRRGRGRERGPEGMAEGHDEDGDEPMAAVEMASQDDGYSDRSGAEPSRHFTEIAVDDFQSAVMPDDLLPETAAMAEPERPAEPRERRGRQEPREGRSRREPRTPRPAPEAAEAGDGGDQPTAEEALPAAAVPAAAPPPVSEAESAEPPAPRRSLSSSSEPKLERVVVRTNTSETEQAEAPASAPKRGWWQRRLGG